MKTTLLKLTTYRRPGLRSFMLDGAPMELKVRRCYRGRMFSLVWFPCWILNCCWDVWNAEYRALHALTRKALQHPNSHYLPFGGAPVLRAILK